MFDNLNIYLGIFLSILTFLIIYFFVLIKRYKKIKASSSPLLEVYSESESSVINFKQIVINAIILEIKVKRKRFILILL